ncbi:DUF4097 family beta strand repeat-containing protein [Aquimarina algicola]|uniref:DUF4097 domain-containing protein n=1 Tax=Aquimarina algicola TaxID=2589995 RepID=A0A504JMJ8_9FLAO|nr:DUF4097 family beta strand repeat-containing protein [Aquimarina algicola]TPN87640.1 DUF4097 domain-containing protein [Aquimarina algicola]
MKNIFTLSIFCLFVLSTYAQKVIEKNIKTSSKEVSIEFKFAEDIIVRTWDKKDVYLKSQVSVKDGEFDNYFNLKIDNNTSILNIKSDYGDLFDKWKKERRSNKNNSWDSCNNLNIDAYHTLYLPKNTKLKIKSISGNVQSENYQGQLTVDIISGNIDIKKYNGDLKLKTISGDIDINIAKSTLKAETLSGTIYSEKDMQFDHSKNRISGNTVSGTFGDPNHQLSLGTISGNIYLRKQ